MDLHVVTVTSICKIDGVSNIYPAKLFHAMDVDDTGKGKVPFVEFSTNRVRVSKGVFLANKNNRLRFQPHKVPAVGHRAAVKGSGFRHMLTMLVRVDSSTNNSCYVVNVKVFKNGQVQMTGLKTPEDGNQVAEAVVDAVATAVAKDPEVVDLVPGGGIIIAARDYKVCMINGIFAIPFSVDRQKTHEMLLKKGMHSIYDPMLYHAVKLRVHRPSAARSGTQKTCATVAIFQTGSVIITGTTTMDEMAELHRMVKGVLEENVKDIQRVEWRIVKGS